MQAHNNDVRQIYKRGIPVVLKGRRSGGEDGGGETRWEKRGGGVRGEEGGIREEAWIIHRRITTGLRQGGSQKYPRPRRLGAITLQRSTTRQQPLLLPVSVSSGSKTLGGIIKSHCDVAVYSKTSSVMQYKAETHTSLCLYITHRTIGENDDKWRKNGSRTSSFLRPYKMFTKPPKLILIDFNLLIFKEALLHI